MQLLPWPAHESGAHVRTRRHPGAVDGRSGAGCRRGAGESGRLRHLRRRFQRPQAARGRGRRPPRANSCRARGRGDGCRLPPGGRECHPPQAARGGGRRPPRANSCRARGRGYGCRLRRRSAGAAGRHAGGGKPESAVRTLCALPPGNGAPVREPPAPPAPQGRRVCRVHRRLSGAVLPDRRRHRHGRGRGRRTARLLPALARPRPGAAGRLRGHPRRRRECPAVPAVGPPAGSAAGGADRQHRRADANGGDPGRRRGNRLLRRTARRDRGPVPGRRRRGSQHPRLHGVHFAGVPALCHRRAPAVLRRRRRGQDGSRRATRHLAQGDPVDRRTLVQQHVRRRRGPDRLPPHPRRPPGHPHRPPRSPPWSPAPSTWSATRKWSPPPPATTSRPSWSPTKHTRNRHDNPTPGCPGPTRFARIPCARIMWS